MYKERSTGTMNTIKQLKEDARISESWVGTHQVGDYPDPLGELFPASIMQAAQDEITTWPGYAPTALRNLDGIASASRVASVFYKDESTRFGLGSFKALGGAYAVLHYLAGVLSERLGRAVTMVEIRSGALAAEAAKITVATATDGNHGRSVAWGAQMAGCQCRIYIHREVSKGREDAMAAFGANVIRIDGDYDESVRLAAKEASTNGWQVISDTSYEGYLDVPRQVMAGYTVMVREILGEMKEPPTHVIIQAGVGGLAASICAAFWSALGENRPRFIITESERAACIMESVRNQKPSHVNVAEETIMAGLSCGEISLIAWEILSRGACAVTTLPDDAVAPAMRVMAGLGIEAGECAVPGIITLMALAKDPALFKAVGLDENSSILVFGCEGATDRQLYDSIING
jgi:diaminopropionate ammonia-lyase